MKHIILIITVVLFVKVTGCKDDIEWTETDSSHFIIGTEKTGTYTENLKVDFDTAADDITIENFNNPRMYICSKNEINIDTANMEEYVSIYYNSDTEFVIVERNDGKSVSLYIGDMSEDFKNTIKEYGFNVINKEDS